MEAGQRVGDVVGAVQPHSALTEVAGVPDQVHRKATQDAIAIVHLHHHVASLTMAVLILFVVCTFFVHINRMLNAGFLVQPQKALPWRKTRPI